MTVRDLTPEQRRELLAAWDAAVRSWWSDRDIFPTVYYWRLQLCFDAGLTHFGMRTPEAVAHGN